MTIREKTLIKQLYYFRKTRNIEKVKEIKKELENIYGRRKHRNI